MNEHKPSCRLNATSGQVDDCRDRDLWLGIYHDFHIRRQVGDFFYSAQMMPLLRVSEYLR